MKVNFTGLKAKTNALRNTLTYELLLLLLLMLLLLLLLLQAKDVPRVLKTQQQTLCDSSIRTLCLPSKTMFYLWSHSSYNRVSLQKCTSCVTYKAKHVTNLPTRFDNSSSSRIS